MQGPSGFLNVLTIPTGATIYEPRIVIDGVRGALFVYGSGGQAGSGLPPQVVQSKVIPNALSGSFNTPTTEGNTVVVIICGYTTGTTPSISEVTLGGSNVNFNQWINSVSADVSSTVFGTFGWAQYNTPGNQTAVAVTVENLQVNTDLGIIILELANMYNTISIIDQFTNDNGNSLDWTSGTTPETTVQNEFWIGSWVTNFIPVGILGAPWTSLVFNPGAGNQGCQYQIVQTLGTAEVNGSQPSSGTWASGIMTLKGNYTGVLAPLIASISTTGGVDPYNFIYLPGVVSYGPTEASAIYAGSLYFYTGNPLSGWSQLANIGAGENGSSQGIVNVIAAGGLYINGVGPVTP